MSESGRAPALGSPFRAPSNRQSSIPSLILTDGMIWAYLNEVFPLKASDIINLSSSRSLVSLLAMDVAVHTVDLSLLCTTLPGTPLQLERVEVQPDVRGHYSKPQYDRANKQPLEESSITAFQMRQERQQPPEKHHEQDS